MSTSDEGWEDDDMADLFSFGNDTAPPPEETMTPPPPAAAATLAASPPPETPPKRDTSHDSILDMLDADTDKEASLLGERTSSKPAVPMEDADAQEILNWLDEEDTPVVSSTDDVKTKVEEMTQEETKQHDTAESTETETDHVVEAPAPTPTFAVIPPPQPELVRFESLEHALTSSESNMDHVRALFVDGGMKVDIEHRPQLWCRAVCGKTLEEVMSNSLAESFLEFQEPETTEDERSVYIRTEAAILADRIVAGTDMTTEEAKRALCAVLLFYYQSSFADSKEMDPLLPPVACALLSAGIPAPAVTVMLTRIMPTFMPLLALSQDDRWDAAKSLHTQFYLLACYHLPLLVFHLDRHVPGWYWPKKLGTTTTQNSDETATEMGRNLESHGVVPQSWLISHLAGECGGTLMNPKWLLSLWDLILTSCNNSLRFFLSLAVLEKHSDTLLMLTDDNLMDELNRIMEFKEGTTPEGFAIVAEEETSETEAGDWVQEWCERARSLWEATPRSVVSQLRAAEDEAVNKALMERQKRSEQELQARLEAEAKAHREAAEAERERKADEARQRLNRARLALYYKTHNPEKEDNIDKIMKVYEGRLDVLDMKLKAKYGVGFKPALKPKSRGNAASMLLSSMNQGLNSARNVNTAQAPTPVVPPKIGDPEHQVAVKVSATEVLPIICWSKEAAASKGVTALARGRYNDEYRVPLKFYLVDSRPEATAQEQGRFPTAVAMSPEALMDPDRMEQNEEMFESLRGAVHICIMGEGYSAIPHLYGQKATPKLQKFVDEDESRTSLCALFFIKKGFPFVSVLDGGFVGAHSWLAREGPKRHLTASAVLVDYDETNSFFARMERNYKLANEGARAKTQHIIQNLFDSSMTTLTRNAQRFEKVAAEFDSFVPKQGEVAEEEEEEDVVAEEDDFAGSPTKPTETVDEEKQKEERAEQSSFANRFASIRSAAGNLRRAESARKESDKESEPKEDGTVNPSSTDVSEQPKFRNPFAGFRGAADSVRKSEADIDTSKGQDSQDEGDAQPNINTPKFRNPFAGRKGVVPEKEDAADDVKEKVNEESDTEDLVDVSIADTSKPRSFAKNPFARFGGQAPVGTTENEGAKPNRFGGIKMNQLRLNALSNLRGKGPDGGKPTEELDEESISFTSSDSPKGDTTEKPTEEAVVESV